MVWDLTAGGVGGLASVIAAYPLDTVNVLAVTW